MDWSYGSSKELTLQGQGNRGIILLNLLKFCYFTTPHRYHIMALNIRISLDLPTTDGFSKKSLWDNLQKDKE